MSARILFVEYYKIAYSAIWWGVESLEKDKNDVNLLHVQTF
jgi:hypothetical protein